MFAAVGKSFRLLLQLSEFLKVMRREAYQMALARDGDLQRLANPPSGICRQACAVAHVEAVDCLHQPAHRFLEQVGVAQGMMPEALGYVGGEADVRRSEPVLTVDIPVVNTSNGRDAPNDAVAMVADELRHRPWFERRTMRAAGENVGSTLEPGRSWFPKTN